MKIQEHDLKNVVQGIRPIAEGLDAKDESEEKTAKAKAVFATCQDMQLYHLPLNQMWDVIQNSIF